MDAFHLPEVDAFLRYADVPGPSSASAQPRVLVYLTGLGLAVGGTFDRAIASPGLAEHRSVLVDFLGAGLSDAPESFGYTLDDHARTVAAFLDHLALTATTVIGYSLGGSVAITLAATRPDLVASLVVAEPNLDPGGGFLSRRIAEQSEERFRAEGFAALIAEYAARARDGHRVAAIAGGMLRIAAPHALYRSARGLVRGTAPTMRERLVQMEIPRQLIRGATSGPARKQDELEKSGIRVHVVPGAGHGMMWENPDGFVEKLTAAVADVERR